MHFRVFSYGQNVGYFWGLLKFQKKNGMLEIPNIFFLWGGGVKGRCWVRAYV